MDRSPTISVMSTDETVHGTPVAATAPGEDPGTDAGTHAGSDVDRPVARRRDHPVFAPLAGFFTGAVLVVFLGGLLGVILDLVLDYDVGEHLWILLVAVAVLLVVTVVLISWPRTRRFGRYMLLGVIATPAVIAAVAALTFWLLLRNDG